MVKEDHLKSPLKTICPISSNHYTFRVLGSDTLFRDEVFNVISELNTKLKKEVFQYIPDSTNAIIIKDSIEKIWILKYPIDNNEEPIGSTLCSQPCCGTNTFSIELKESELVDPIEAKMLVWHELGHVVGLEHNDSYLAIMNAEIMDSKDYDKTIEKDFLTSAKKLMGL